MANWKHKINIGQYIHQYEEDSDIHKVYDGIYKEISNEFPNLNHEDELTMILHELSCAAVDEDPDLFDDFLVELYDWADHNLVWLGAI